MKFHHLKQLEQLKSEPKGSFLMLSIHLFFEEIIADLNLANPTSDISFLASPLIFSYSYRKVVYILTIVKNKFKQNAIFSQINSLYIQGDLYKGILSWDFKKLF